MKHIGTRPFALLALALLTSCAASKPKLAPVKERQMPKAVASQAQAFQRSSAAGRPPQVSITIFSDDLARLYPEDPGDREKAEVSVLISDGRGTSRAVVSAGGQSTLRSATPNLRVKKIEPLIGEGKTIAGVENQQRTTRINPLTMDEGYVATRLYLDLLNGFSLVPRSTGSQHFQQSAEFAAVVYVPVSRAGRIEPEDVVPAGLHLITHHPVKFLAEAQSGQFGVQAVARSRYNVVNLRESLFGGKLGKDFFTSTGSDRSTTPFRAEHEWAEDDAARSRIEAMIRDVYAAPEGYRGEALYQALDARMDVQQLFRFMAINHILENGDISDEYFWYTQVNKRNGEVRLGILPQDGDDALKGVHPFPVTPKQIGLIFREKIGSKKGYIFNFEDPLFRAVRDDEFLYYEYLKTYRQVASEFLDSEWISADFDEIGRQLDRFSRDPDVLARGASDEVGLAYGPSSFSERVKLVRQALQANAKRSIDTLDGSAGDLEKARLKMLGQSR